MRNRYLLLLLLFALFIISGCKNTLELNDTWKEIDVVYGLLDERAPVYIRIEKAYLNGDQSAIKIAAESRDSIYHNDTLDVRLQEWQNGEKRSEAKLKKVFLTNRDSGAFSYPGQYLYTVDDVNYKLDPRSTYTLLVKNPKTGVTVKASTPIVDSLLFSYPTGSILFQHDKSTPVLFTSGANVYFYDMVFHIYYSESNSATEKRIDWPIFKMKSAIPSKDFPYNINGNDFFGIIREYVPSNENLTRKLDSLTLDISGGTETLYNYIDINTPSLGVTQKKPDYTNVQNGYGIFSSRSFFHQKLIPSKNTINELKKENLQFE